MRRLTRYEMSSVDGEIYLDSSNTRLINAAEAKVCLARDVGDIENDLYEQEEKTNQYKVLYQEKCRDINNQERFFAKQLNHQKFKRILNIVDKCGQAVSRYLAEGRLYEIDSITAEGERRKELLEQVEDCDRKATFYDRWYHRWSEIAEKFK